MNINLDLYNYFYYVCEFKSVTKAAHFLYVSQPAITKQIKNLESRLGKTLILRNPNGIELTEDGELLYHEIKDSIEKLNATEAIFRERSDQYNQTIRMVAGHSTLKSFLIKSLLQFNEIHPGIKFDVKMYFYPENIQLLKEGKLDLVFVSLDEVQEFPNNIVFEEFMEVDDVFVVHKNLKEEFPDFISLKDLNNYPIICLTSNMLSRKWLNHYYQKLGLTFQPKYEIPSTWLIREYVEEEAGIGLLVKQHVLDKLKSGEFIEIQTDESLPKRKMGYAYRKDSLNYPVIKEFIEYLKTNIE